MNSGLIRRSWLVLPALLLLGTGCPAEDDDDGDSAADDTTSGDDGATMTDGMTSVADDDDDDDDDDSLDETGDPDPPSGECFLWGDDCSDDSQKCMPWSLLPDRIPDETRCCPLVNNPKLENEECTVFDYDGSCEDDCEDGTMCLVDNFGELSGVCRRFCEPGASEDCDIADTCKPFFELLPSSPEVPLCMDRCDPLVQDCVQPGWHCIPDSPTDAGQSGFICTPPPPDSPNPIFTACGLANDCEPGLVCITSDRVPDCDFTSCCTAFCDLEEGDAPCADLDQDLQCVDWMSPDPEWQNIGACAIPS